MSTCSAQECMLILAAMPKRKGWWWGPRAPGSKRWVDNQVKMILYQERKAAAAVDSAATVLHAKQISYLEGQSGAYAKPDLIAIRRALIARSRNLTKQRDKIACAKEGLITLDTARPQLLGEECQRAVKWFLQKHDKRSDEKRNAIDAGQPTRMQRPQSASDRSPERARSRNWRTGDVSLSYVRRMTLSTEQSKSTTFRHLVLDVPHGARREFDWTLTQILRYGGKTNITWRARCKAWMPVTEPKELRQRDVVFCQIRKFSHTNQNQVYAFIIKQIVEHRGRPRFYISNQVDHWALGCISFALSE